MKLVTSPRNRGCALFAAVVFVAFSGVALTLGSAHAGSVLEERKLPMKFSWVDCQPDCRGWVSAVGIVTSDSPRDFNEFARGRELNGATIVLDSSGGSVNDAITLGRRWRDLGVLTTVGISIHSEDIQGERARVMPEAYCESMCVFLMLSGKTRYVPDTAHVRVHQIWMGDRAEDAKAASYSAEDLMIVERDVGRLAKYTFDMGGAGDLLLLSLNVPPWEDLHQLSPAELKSTNLVTTKDVADVLPRDVLQDRAAAPMAELTKKPVQERFTGVTAQAEAASPADKTASEKATPAISAIPERATKTAEASVPTGGGVTSK